MKKNPDLSIITVNLNNSPYITDTINSVYNQKKINYLEYIIIDGKSSDNSVKIIKSYESKFKKKYFEYKWISEKDKGIYYAMNKGLKLANGNIIGFLNSGDLYVDDNVLFSVLQCFEKNNINSLYGDLEYVNKNNIEKTIRYWNSGEFNKKYFLYGWMCPHPTFFVKRKIYNKYKGFNTDFKIASDYELILRFLYRYNITTYYLNKVLVKMRTGGISNNSLKNLFNTYIENKNAWKINNLKLKWYTLIFKRFIKLRQFIKMKTVVSRQKSE